MFRSQNSLEDMLDHAAHMIQRREGFSRGGRLNIAAQDLSDGTGEDIRVGEDEHSAGIYATNQTRLFTSGFSLMRLTYPQVGNSPFLEWVVLVFKTVFRSEHPLVRHPC